jgi:tetratricopeptide (TPR) repeat protein
VSNGNFFDKVAGLYQQINDINKQIDKVYNHAKNKEFRQGVSLAKLIVSGLKSANVPACQRMVLDISLKSKISTLETLATSWMLKIGEAEGLLSRGRSLEKAAESDPLDLQKLTDVLRNYQQAFTLLNEPDVKTALDNVKAKIKQRQTCMSLIQEGERLERDKLFIDALDAYRKAKRIFSTEDIEGKIRRCFQSSQKEAQYKLLLDRAIASACGGDFTGALTTIEAALRQFDRADGVALQQRLNNTIKGKQLYEAATLAEKEGNIEQALNLYDSALKTLPELEEAKVRWAVIAIKREDFNGAIKTLTGMDSPEASYMRGFSYAKLKNWEAAEREWQSLHRIEVATQIETLGKLQARESLLTMKTIEKCVEDGRLDNAETISLHYLNKFGT